MWVTRWCPISVFGIYCRHCEHHTVLWYLFKMKCNKTRKHSSRMRTTRLPTVWVLWSPLGVSTRGRILGIPTPPGYSRYLPSPDIYPPYTYPPNTDPLPQHTYTPTPWTELLTDTCENITGKVWTKVWVQLVFCESLSKTSNNHVSKELRIIYRYLLSFGTYYVRCEIKL